MSDEVCKQPQGKFTPVVDFSRCEAKGLAWTCARTTYSKFAKLNHPTTQI